MRHIVKTLFFCFALSLFTGCSAQRRIQRIVERHPELIEVKYRTIDSILTVPGYADHTIIPISSVTGGETYYENTDHGTFIVSVNPQDSTLHVGFVADTQQVRYLDTIQYSQVVITPEQPEKGWLHGFGERLAEWACFLFIGMAVAFYFIWKTRTNQNK